MLLSNTSLDKTISVISHLFLRTYPSRHISLDLIIFLLQQSGHFLQNLIAPFHVSQGSKGHCLQRIRKLNLTCKNLSKIYIIQVTCFYLSRIWNLKLYLFPLNIYVFSSFVTATCGLTYAHVIMKHVKSVWGTRYMWYYLKIICLYPCTIITNKVFEFEHAIPQNIRRALDVQDFII